MGCYRDQTGSTIDLAHGFGIGLFHIKRWL